MKKKRLLFPFTNPVSLLTGTVRDYLGIFDRFEVLENPVAIETTGFLLCAGNRT